MAMIAKSLFVLFVFLQIMSGAIAMQRQTMNITIQIKPPAANKPSMLTSTLFPVTCHASKLQSARNVVRRSYRWRSRRRAMAC